MPPKLLTRSVSQPVLAASCTKLQSKIAVLIRASLLRPVRIPPNSALVASGLTMPAKSITIASADPPASTRSGPPPSRPFCSALCLQANDRSWLSHIPSCLLPAWTDIRKVDVVPSGVRGFARAPCERPTASSAAHSTERFVCVTRFRGSA